METEKRLERLEHELMNMKRRYRRLLVVTGLVAAVMAAVLIATKVGGPVVAFAETGIADEVKARRFVLVDEQGDTRALLAVLEDGPALFLIDPQGTPRAMLAILEDGPTLSLTDPQGTPLAMLDVSEGVSALSLIDPQRTPRATLAVLEDGPTLLFTDLQGQNRAVLGTGSTTTSDGRKTTYPESSLRLYKPDGTVLWMTP